MSAVGERKPLSRQRSPWTFMGTQQIVGDFTVDKYLRRVGDGMLRVFVGLEPEGWHLSISFVNHKGEPSRYPRWDEIADARYALLADDLTMSMLLPPPDAYVALHDSTFHLHEVKR